MTGPATAHALRSALGLYGAALFDAVPVGCEAIAASELVVPETLLAAIERTAVDSGAPDERVAASLWLKSYSWAVVRALLPAMTLAGVGLDGSLANTSVVVSGNFPRGVLLTDLGSVVRYPPRYPANLPRSDDVASVDLAGLHAFVTVNLIERHLLPVVDALHGLTRLSRQIMWGSIGYACANLLGELAALPGMAVRAGEDWRMLFGSNGPLRDSVRIEEHAALATPVVVRRTCCLWYRVRPDDPCYYCPLLKPDQRAAAMRRMRLA